jgi:site-specific recombinase XerD
MLQTQIIAREITLGQIVQTFLDEELLAVSKQTRKWYASRLRLFLSQIGEDKPLSEIEKKDLTKWWKSLEDRTLTKPPTLSVDTFYSYVRAVRQLFKYLDVEHHTLTPLWRVIKLPKLPERERKGIKDENILKFFEAALENPRDYAIMHFMESTGCRRGGVASITFDDLNLENPARCRRAIVHEKGMRARSVIMSQEALDALRAWLKVRPASVENFIFVNTFAPYDGLTPGAISSMIARYKKSAGITGRCSPHQWRHRFCRARIMEGVPLSAVSEMAGHKSVVVTATFYGNLLTDELQIMYDKFYKPVEKPAENSKE